MKPVVKLGDLAASGPANFVDGPFGSNLKATEYQDAGIPIIRLQNIRPHEFLKKGIKFISSQKAAELARHDFRPGDLVIAKLGDPAGVACIVPDGMPSGRIVADVVRFRGNIKRVDHAYVSRFLNSPNARAQLDRGTTGTTRKRINLTKLKLLQIPLPPLAEQKRIAGVLDAADALRTKRRESLAELDALLQSTFLSLFGDPVENPMGWEVVPLENLGRLDRGVSKHRPRNDPKLLGGPYPLIQTGDVSNSGGYIRKYTSTYSELGLKQSRLWPAGTLCITIAANIANTGILTFDACFPDSVVGFTFGSPGRGEYVQGLFWFFRKILNQQATQVAQKNINLKILREFNVPFPPLDLQRRFAATVESIEQHKAVQRAHLVELDALFASLQHRAFNGKLQAA
jgi:type I restriction enzyme S subunit